MHIESMEKRLFMAAGQLDTTFSGDGRVPFPFGPGSVVGVQPDGRIVLSRDDAGGFRLDRLNADGSADNTFLGGATVTAFASSTTPFFDVNPVDGRIAMVAGTPTGNDTRVAVFKADGSPDNSFDTDGIAHFDVNFAASRIAWQGSQLVFLGGLEATGGEIGVDALTLRRINSNGALDSSFGTSGVATLAFEPVDAGELQIGPGGKINVAAERQKSGGRANANLSIFRLTPEGDPDGTFGGGAGVITVDSDTDDFSLRQLAFNVGDDGSLYHLSNSDVGVQLRKFTPEGVISITSATLNPASWNSGTYLPDQLELQPDGKMLLIGEGSGTNGVGWSVVRLNPDTTIDTTYGTDGIARPQAAHNGRAAVQTDGKVLVSGDRFGVEGFEVMRIDTGDLNLGTIRLNKRGTLLINGTAAGELLAVSIRGRDGKLIARVGTFAIGFSPSKVKRIAIFAGAGDDTVNIGAGVKGSYAQGDDGFDTLNGGTGDDVLLGGLNPDKMYGNDGNDILVGEGGADYCLGGAGKDDLFGNGGVDTLSGAGGNDRLFGGGEADHVLGGAGTDSAALSDEDEFNSIESFLTPPPEP